MSDSNATDRLERQQKFKDRHRAIKTAELGTMAEEHVRLMATNPMYKKFVEAAQKRLDHEMDTEKKRQEQQKENKRDIY